MRVLSLEIKNYRCFEDFRLDVDGKSLLLIAPNAGGKTSLLTATHMALQGGREVRLSDFSDPALPIEIVATLGDIPPTAHAAFAQTMTFGQPPQLRVGIRATWDAHEGELRVLHGFPDDGWRRAGRDARTNLPVFWLSASREVSRLLAFTGARSLLNALVRTLDLEEPLDSAVADMSTVARQLSDAPELQAMLASLRDELATLVPGVAPNGYRLGVDATESRDLLRQFELLLEHEGPPGPIVSRAGGLGQLTIAAVTLRLVAREPGAVLLVDEPEQALHPQAQRALVTALGAAAGQSIIATHSANVLSHIDPRRITRLRRNAAGDTEAVSTAPLTDDDARRATRYATAQTTEAYFAHTIVMVEGPSDLLALREFAESSGILLDAKGITVLSLEGADVFGAYLTLLGPGGLDLQIRGVCDADHETRWITELNRVGVPVTDRASLNSAGIHVCDPDLEAELLGALTSAEIEEVFMEDGGLREFQTFAQQPGTRSVRWTNSSLSLSRRPRLGGLRSLLRLLTFSIYRPQWSKSWRGSDIDEIDDLDDEQRAAVTATDKAIAVLAGPGSGKTRTLFGRARHLLLGAPDSRALLLTFTNKAAAEMKTRAMGVSVVASDRIDASTFHTFGANLLRSHGDLIGISPDFDILDDEQAEELAKEAARIAGLRHGTSRQSPTSSVSTRSTRLSISSPILP